MSTVLTYRTVILIAIAIILIIAASAVSIIYSPPNTHTSSIIPLPDNFVSPQIQCTGDGIIAFVPGYILNKSNTYTIEFAENTSTNHPEGLWVLRMKNKETENILVKCV